MNFAGAVGGLNTSPELPCSKHDGTPTADATGLAGCPPFSRAGVEDEGIATHTAQPTQAHPQLPQVRHNPYFWSQNGRCKLVTCGSCTTAFLLMLCHAACACRARLRAEAACASRSRAPTQQRKSLVQPPRLHRCPLMLRTLSQAERPGWVRLLTALPVGVGAGVRGHLRTGLY